MNLPTLQPSMPHVPASHPTTPPYALPQADLLCLNPYVNGTFRATCSFPNALRDY